MKFNFLFLIALILAGSLTAAAQSPSIVGTWALTAADKLLPDGTRSHDYGDNPCGLVIFTEDGHYSVQIYRDERTKFASGDKLKGSPEEYKDAVLGMSVHYGKYSIDPAKNTISFQIDRASFPNWDGKRQVRDYTYQDGVLSYAVPASAYGGGKVAYSVWQRVGQ